MTVIYQRGVGPVLTFDYGVITDFSANKKYQLNWGIVSEFGGKSLFKTTEYYVTQIGGPRLFRYYGSTFFKIRGHALAEVSDGIITDLTSDRQFEITGHLSRVEFLTAIAILFMAK